MEVISSLSEKNSIGCGAVGVIVMNDGTHYRLAHGRRGLVTRLPRRPGMKEQRYAHLFSGEPSSEKADAASPAPARLRVMAENERLAALEEEVRRLREKIAGLRKELEAFRGQFE